METPPQEKAVLVSWSGGKDSCMALREIHRTPNLRVEALLTTITRDYDRISMHGVRRILLEQQAASLGIPLHQILISKGASNEEYETKMGEVFAIYREHGIRSVAFGDLFLEEIRAYRERLLARHAMIGLYPVWKRDTLAFDPSFLGRLIDEEFLSQLPPGVDPCGERGEFHTFVFDGPMFRHPVKFVFGEKICRDSFWFCDLLPAD